MKILSTYSVKVKQYNRIFQDTVKWYRKATEYLIIVCLNEWDGLESLPNSKAKYNAIEKFCIETKKNPAPKYDFSKCFYKMPAYLRRAAIADALGKVSSYKSNLANWEAADPRSRGKAPSIPAVGNVYPALYRDGMYVREDDYTARIKVYTRNTWDWLTVKLKKSDADYILHHCKGRKECVPTLRRRGKEWFLDFAFEEKVTLEIKPIFEQTVVAVDLGINNACTCSVMTVDGTILGRRFLKLPREQDSLHHSLQRIKKTQQHGARRMPRLWNKAIGINKDISSKTAQFITDTAVYYNADVIVFEHLNLDGKPRGSKKQKLKLWRARDVQRIVTDKAHRLGMRISRVNAWGTSRLAFDGSGRVMRGKEAGLKSYSVCKFKGGKVYNCDLNASYNIGARYFVREVIKSLPVRVRLDIEAKVPQCIKRSTCTLSTLISLNAELVA